MRKAFIGSVIREKKTIYAMLRYVVPTVLLASVLLIAVDVFRSRFYFVFDAATYLDLHNIAEFFSVAVSLSIFGFGWYTYRQSHNNYTLFLGVAFLGISIIDFLHALSFPGMPSLITPSSTDKGIQFWIAARLLAAIAFLVSAFIPSRESTKRLPSKLLLVFVMMLSLFMFMWVNYLPQSLPVYFVPGIGLTPFKMVMEYSIIAITVLAFVAYQWRYFKTKDIIYLWFMAALIMSVFSELSFTLYRSAYDTFNLLGHVLKVVAFVLIYRGVFVTWTNDSFIQLRKSEAKFATAFMNSPTFMAITVPETGEIVEINKAFSELLGYAPSKIIGKTTKSLRIWADPSQRDEVLAQLKETGSAHNLEVTLRTKHGLRTVIDSFDYVDLKEGRYLLSVAVDITERQKTAKALLQSEGELSKANRMLKTLSRCGQVLIHAKDIDTLLQKTCDALITTGGYKFAWIGTAEHNKEKSLRPLATAGSGANDYITAIQPTWANTAQMPSGKAVRLNRPVFVNNVKTDPLAVSWREVASKHGIMSVAALPLMVDDKVVGVLGVYSESIESFGPEVMEPLMELAGNLSYGMKSIKTEERQQYAQKHAKQLSDLRAKFIKIVSHQLRTPLGSVRWNLELLLGDGVGRLTGAQKQLIEVTHDANVSAINRLNDLLLIMDIEEGRVGYVKKTVVLNDLMRPIIEIVQKKCHDKGLTCEFREPPQPLPAVRADAQKMRLAFTKLVENAIQYTPKGGHVAVELKQEGSRIRFEVTDTGIGIPKADQPNIGKGFFRASNAFLSEPDASGVGLAIVTYIVNEQDGVMGFTSKEGQGSTFWFEIPIISLSNKTVTKT